MMGAIRVVLVDDHALVRAGIAELLRQIGNVQVVGEADDGRDALNVIKNLRPDIVLMDISMPELNGLEVIERLSRDEPNVRIIVLSMHQNEEYVLRALSAGAAGYLLKAADRLELEVAIRAVASGKRYLSSGISKQMIDLYVKRTHLQQVTGPGLTGLRSYHQLSPRQREILQLIAESNSTKDIAQKLHLSVKTVDTHRTELMKRLDIHDVSGLVRYAIRSGLVSAG
jgi:DNA-binding NarL/FixJ family response regulator